MIVADASALVEALVGEGSVADAVRGRIIAATQVHAPHLVDLEVGSAIRRLSRADGFPGDLATTALKQLDELPLTRYPHRPFLDRIWELQDSLTPYDACYVALAEAVGAPLLTLDTTMVNATGVRCRFEIIG